MALGLQEMPPEKRLGPRVQDDRSRKMNSMSSQSKHKRERAPGKPSRVARCKQRIVAVGGLGDTIAQHVEDVAAECEPGRGCPERVGDGATRKRSTTHTHGRKCNGCDRMHRRRAERGDRGRLETEEPGVRRRQLAQEHEH